MTARIPACPTPATRMRRSLPMACLATARRAPAADRGTTSAEGLLKKYACIACHSVDAKLVGPSYKDVAAKYRNQKDAEQTLVGKVKQGGVGVWGQVPMPPNATVPDADLQAMVKWILALQ